MLCLFEEKKRREKLKGEKMERNVPSMVFGRAK